MDEIYMFESKKTSKGNWAVVLYSRRYGATNLEKNVVTT